jgi:hypothetical protein
MAGETLNIIDCDLLGNATGGVTGTITVQGADSLEEDSIAIDVATDLGFDLDEVVNCTSSTLDVDAVGTPGESTDNEALLRLLLHEPNPDTNLGNVWEIVPKADAECLWGSNSFNTLWTVVSNEELWALEDSLSGPVQGVTVSNIGETKATVSWTAMLGGEDTDGDDNDILYFVWFTIDMFGTDVPYGWMTTTKTSVTTASGFLLDNETYTVMVRVDPNRIRFTQAAGLMEKPSPRLNPFVSRRTWFLNKACRMLHCYLRSSGKIHVVTPSLTSSNSALIPPSALRS